MTDATVKVTLTPTGFRKYDAAVTVAAGGDGRVLYEHTATFANSNAVFPAYKALGKAINHLPRLGVEEIDVVTNCAPMANELTGGRNANTALLTMIRERLAQAGVTIGEVTKI
ncbi:hypothetical protein [Numidum massiliense]|uniref:hypothetical protein n=1 Tax=Numidum massiliense TaxID=1522315 RepID=UPI0006D54BE1|nr:hypothetical protein [Numidum massiliense]